MLSSVARTVRSWFDRSVTPGVAKISLHPLEERFPLPHTFKPQLNLRGALIAVSYRLTSIFAGCLLFGICGATAWMAMERIPNPLLRVAALIPMLATFLALLALLLTGISKFFRAILQAWVS
jgi:hypothetical protein